jgi:hypothetical protein
MAYRKITKTVSDAPIISKKSVILERKMAVSARKRRTNKTLGGLGGLSSPREEDEGDQLDSGSVHYRRLGGRKPKGSPESKSMSVFFTSITTLSKDIRRPGKLIMEME